MQQDTNKPTLLYTAATTIDDVLCFIYKHQSALGITLYQEASEEVLLAFEKSKIRLPDDVKYFYGFCNGFESGEDMFRIIPLEEIMSAEPDQYLMNDTCFHFAEYLIYCDMWTVNINTVNNNDYEIYNEADSRVVLTNSFSEFLTVFLNGGVFDGLYDCRNQKATN